MATFGDLSAEFTLANTGANTKFAAKFTLSEDALVSKLTIYRGNTAAGHAACNVKGIIYSNTTAAPNVLMGTTNALAVADNQAAGWVDLPFASPVTLAAGIYWLGTICDANGAGFGVYRGGASSGNREWIADTYADGAANPWGTHANATTYTYSVYATYTTPAAASPAAHSGRFPAIRLVRGL